LQVISDPAENGTADDTRVGDSGSEDEDDDDDDEWEDEEEKEGAHETQARDEAGGEEEAETGGEETDGDEEGDEEGGHTHGSPAPARDHAAAALTVGVGSFNDTDELHGMAHFVEHMVFMGSKKYPGENDFDTFLTKHGGGCNAYTDMECTT
jgi:nardilysin